uniref:Uncharacterized protein n=1 Tax=Arundo donax TaxID=35708 RepID=A0A0A9BSN8_ARUDO
MQLPKKPSPRGGRRRRRQSALTMKWASASALYNAGLARTVDVHDRAAMAT